MGLLSSLWWTSRSMVDLVNPSKRRSQTIEQKLAHFTQQFIIIWWLSGVNFFCEIVLLSPHNEISLNL